MINQKLRNHFSIVKKSSLFKSYYEGVDADTIPGPIEKHVLRDILETRFQIENEREGVYLVRSGGSTDKPLIFPVDIKENLYQRELLAKELVEFGVFSSKTIALNLFSYTSMYRSAAILDDILERCNATTIACGAKTPFEYMFSLASKFKANIVIGTPSVLTLFAQYVIDNKLTLKIDNLLFAGEYLLKSQAEIIKKAFNTIHMYSLYGSAETGIWGWSLYSENSTSFEVLDDVIIEIENPDEEGNGMIVVTNLLRKRFPVFRYYVGDIGHLDYKDGRQILTLKSRESKSFSIEATSYFLDDFDMLLTIVDRFQIQLSLDVNLKTELKFLIIKPTLNKQEKEGIANKVEERLKGILDMNPDYFTLKINLVSQTDLYSKPTTSKTPIIIDFRN
ncbi:phenylacetate-CoA ligase [Tenacibaculum sp. MAR_2009_124]|uniref:hypothetical protein n=1 Tax=Tenacibaculum sp. MAR_2009_124 TaxID=1250059 RepID=UPI00089526C3|nr:hypothetical protein [Tenacibaculum sp. MAR_2009_124]SEB37758.1 phenylacetate-CoA ligase [Tenacibaculum sp. MAR_2009_124]